MMFRWLFIISVWLLAGGAFAQQGGTLTVVGQGSFASAPDMATITMGVTTQARTAAGALAKNSSQTADMLAAIARLSVAGKDVQTSGLNLSPIWNNRSSSGNQQPDITGYVASNQVSVRVRDLDSLGSILDAVVSAGANQFNGLSFGLQDAVPAADNARLDAVADALRKAGLYAEAAGVTLGSIQQITEQGGASPGPYLARELSAVPIAQGEVAVSASVTVVFEILP